MDRGTKAAAQEGGSGHHKAHHHMMDHVWRATVREHEEHARNSIVTAEAFGTSLKAAENFDDKRAHLERQTELKKLSQKGFNAKMKKLEDLQAAIYAVTK